MTAQNQQEQSSNHPWIQSYSEWLSWDMKIPFLPVWELIDQTAARIPHHSCVDFLGKKYTYEEAQHLINCVAKGLQNLGVKKGDRIGIFMPNTVYYVIFYFAILKSGGVVVNFNPLYVDDEILHQLQDSDTKIMITLDLKFLYDKLARQLSESSTPLEKLIICPFGASLPFWKKMFFSLCKRSEHAKITYNESVLNYEQLIENDGSYTPMTIVPEKDLAVLQYTGGTTGVPKGAMLSHANVYANALQAAPWTRDIVFGQEKILVALPLFHVYAMTAAMTMPIFMGAELYMMFPKFTVRGAIQYIQKYQITLFPGVPTMYGMINQDPYARKANLRSLKACLSGGAGLPLQVKEDFERLTGTVLTEAYGLSETSPAATANPLHPPFRQGSIGIPFSQTIVKILSIEDTVHGLPLEDVREMPFGEKGQIAIKGPQVMLGYWKRPEETKRAFCGDFLLTGDLGYMDKDGFIYLVDRLKDLIICSGFNVYPRIVEEAIYRHPLVAEVTVIGVPDEKRGETVKAFVKLVAQAVLSQEELLDFLKDKLSPIEMPKHIEFRGELPKTMIGKLSKKELKAEEAR